MFRLILTSTVFFALLLCLTAPALSTASALVALGQAQKTPAASDKKAADENKQVPKTEKFDPKNITGEQVAEAAIFVYGSRQLLAQIRRNGVERGRVCKPTCEVPGKTEEASYERRFVRGESADKDRVRLDQKTPSIEYSLIYGDGRLWGIINGAAFTPRQDAANTFSRSNAIVSITF